MNGGGGRQLPSWMMRRCSVEQASISEVKQANKENDLEEVETKAFQPQKKAPRKKRDSGAPLVENKSHLLKKCEARTTQDENGPDLVKQCRASKPKRLQKQEEDQGYDLPRSNLEKEEGSMRKRSRGSSSGKKNKKANKLMEASHDGSNSSGNKKKKKNKFMEGSHDGTVPSQDELTIEDLVSIAEEYVNADMKKELLNSQILQNSGTGSPSSSLSEFGSEKDPVVPKEDRESLIHKTCSSKSNLTDPLSGGKSISCPISTGNPVQDMLNLFLGPSMKKTEEEEWKSDVITRNIMLDYELSKRSQHDNVADVVPATKKKASFKDKVAMLLQ